MTAIVSAYAAYRKSFHASSPDSTGNTSPNEWDTLDNRVNRYRFLWALYENNAFDNASYGGAVRFKAAWALGKNTRGCYNPWGRLGNFWAQHVWIGGLDSRVVNGRVADSACPIMTANEAIREPIARLWRDSNWSVNKEMIPRCGAVLGDCAGRIEDDAKARKVRIIPVNPATITWIKKDLQGNVDAYEIREKRFDPRPGKGDEYAVRGTVDYVEKVRQEGDAVIYQTFLGDEPYPWDGVRSEWTEPYGFVPLVVSPHIHPLPNFCWGWSEYHLGLTKGIEADHVASNLHSQIRKASGPKWLFSGVQKPPDEGLRFAGEAATAANPQPREQEMDAFYGPAGSSAIPLVFNLDTQFTSMEIQNQLANLEKDYAEIRYESARATGDASAKALREVRKACEAKVHSRRETYDSLLSRLQMMALSIGGMKGYEGYQAFPTGSYEDGKLDHTIGPRTVFLLDPLDRAEEMRAFLDNWQVAQLAGVPAEYFLRMNDATEEQIALFNSLIDAQQAKDMAQQAETMKMQAELAPRPAPVAAN